MKGSIQYSKYTINDDFSFNILFSFTFVFILTLYIELIRILHEKNEKGRLNEKNYLL